MYRTTSVDLDITLSMPGGWAGLLPRPLEQGAGVIKARKFNSESDDALPYCPDHEQQHSPHTRHDPLSRRSDHRTTPVRGWAGLLPRPLEQAPAFHIYARKLNIESDDVVFFEHFTCWLRPLDLKLEESVVGHGCKGFVCSTETNS
jgi:hypothetical protein